jgi:hypothetical protein
LLVSGLIWRFCQIFSDSSSCITDYFSDWIENSVKSLPAKQLGLLNPISEQWRNLSEEEGLGGCVRRGLIFKLKKQILFAP